MLARRGDKVKVVERFELRISEEDRQRLRTLAEQTSRTESDVVRFLIRQADAPLPGDITPLRIPVRAPCGAERVCTAA